MVPTLLVQAQALQEEIRDLRRHIHQYPELGMQEYQTSALVENYLQALHIETQRITKTGIVGLLKGGSPGKTLALRADMDALPIQEQTQVSYGSQRPGMMHACGHDAHTAILLGAAKLLSQNRQQLKGNVKFLFQPNEEQEGGALPMILEGCLENPKVDAIFGCHVNPQLPVGKLGISYGKSYAASNPFTIAIHGKGSHGAQPHKGIDTILIGAQIVNALQSIVSRTVDPVDSVVITVGAFHGGTQGNIIAEDTLLTGIIRTLDPQSRFQVIERLDRLVQGIGTAMNAEIQVEIQHSYPALINDPLMANCAKNSALTLLGKENVIILEKPSLGTEDFAFFLEKVPGAFYQLGVVNPLLDGGYPLHSGHFNLDESALPIGAAIHAQVAMDFLNNVSIPS